MLKHWMVGAAGATVLYAMSAVASATPASNTASFAAPAENGSVVEKAASRRCWWRNGRRHCEVVGSRYRGSGYGYGYYYGRPRPEELRTGSTAWWRAMDEEGRGGHGHVP